MWQRVKEFWGALPHQIQAGLALFGTAALTGFIDAATSGVLNAATLKHAAAIGLTAGLIALKAFLSLPSNAQAKLDAQGKAPEGK
jgi:hypothetical protein